MMRKKDKKELNKAILEYLYANDFQNSYDVFLEETGLDPDTDKPEKKNSLETKWKLVGKLNGEIRELKEKIRLMREENDITGILGAAKEGLPMEPERFELKGHSSRITQVAFHPIIDLLASSSADASIKLWD